MLSAFKNKKIIALASLLILSLASVVFILVTVNNTRKNSPTPTGAASWNGIVPGISSSNDVINKLGKPKSTQGNLLFFGSLSPARDNTVIINNNTADLLKEVVAATEKRTTNEITSKYGDAPNIFYGPDSVNGYYLFVYPQNGIAYLGNPLTKSLLEIWYFKPTSINDFETKWASGYSATPQTGNF